MLISSLGLSVIRAIPPKAVLGLLTGQLKLHGGVVRWATGTGQAGRIAYHLLPMATKPLETLLSPISSGLKAMNAIQLHQVSGKLDSLATVTHHVLQLAEATRLFSGLDLAVSTVGFATLNYKLTHLDHTLTRLERQVKAIHALLELEERAKLGTAMQALLNIDKVTDPVTRNQILVQERQSLAQINLKYKELLAKSKQIEPAMAYEEYFSLTALAHARCYAELGALEMAAHLLQEATVFWEEQARRIAKWLLLRKHPERFLFSDFAVDVPVSVLAEWLDLAYGEEKGYGWIDELRQKTVPWYARTYFKKSVFSSNYGSNHLSREKEWTIPSLQKLVARKNVFAGYNAQYEYLSAKKIMPGEFEKQLAAVPMEARVGDYLILQDAPKSQPDQETSRSITRKMADFLLGE